MKDHAVDINWYYKHSKNTTAAVTPGDTHVSQSMGTRYASSLLSWNIQRKSVFDSPCSFHPPSPLPSNLGMMSRNYFQKLGGQSSQVIKPKSEAYSFLIYKLILLGRESINDQGHVCSCLSKEI